MSFKLPIQMYDPKREYKLYKDDIDKAIHDVLNHGIFINGPEVREMEELFESYTGASHCVGVASGTDALLVALMALGIRAGDKVATVAHTWISTAEVISLIGAIPVFVDIEDKTFCMNPDSLHDVIKAHNIKACITVSLYGQVPDMDKINEICGDIPVIEDGAQSFGAHYKGKLSCNLSSIGTTSFFPSKPLGCYGDGGACFTNDKDLADKMKAIRNHGCIKRFHHDYIGLNARLDTLQASVLIAKHKYFEADLLARDKVASYYDDNLKDLINNGLILPHRTGERHVWAQYSLLVNKDDRDKIVAHMKANDVNVAIFYPAPLHTQKCFSYLDKVVLPVTEDVCDRIFNLPCYPYITKDEQDHIIEVVKAYYKKLKLWLD